MDDFGDEAATEPDAGEREVYDLDDHVSDEVDAYMGYEDDDESGNDQGEDDDETDKPKKKGKKQNIFNDEEVEVEEEEEEEEEDQEDQKPAKKSGNTRYEKRVRQLIQKAKDKDQELENLRQGQAQYQQQVYQWQMQQQKNQAEHDKQLALIRADNERFKRQQEIQEETNLDPVEKLQREAARRSREATLAEVNPQIAELRNKMAQAEDQRKRNQARREQEARLKNYEDQAYSATNSILGDFNGKNADGLKNETSGYVLNWAAVNNVLPDDAAKEFDKFAFKYVAARQAGRKKRNGDALTRSGKTPKSIPNKRPSAKGGKKIPSYAELQKQGYPDALAYLEAQDNL